MLLSILDLERVTVNYIMIPRQEISAIDISVSWDDILDRLRQTPHSRLPVYDGELDGRPYFTMDYAGGGSLAQKLATASLRPRGTVPAIGR